MFDCSERPLRERYLLRRPDARCNTPRFRGSHVGVGEGFRKGLRSHLLRAATAVGRLSGSVARYWTAVRARTYSYSCHLDRSALQASIESQLPVKLSAGAMRTLCLVNICPVIDGQCSCTLHVCQYEVGETGVCCFEVRTIQHELDHDDAPRP
ncbi:hypothetical protein K466DRAFT_313155 [Polyporus arcularius HHB13444]|uniref:Uncharacterized protein n=1 Tax=Polyporus arcularius HHB13444 TaxID=1314778 RepID=A0A5C3P0H9_9APHY|nr:hypothetical protein K466DRAFT_313155 [Polyporus arcularius HHB13444]